MELSVRVTPEAEADLISIGDYIAKDSPAAARLFVGKLRQRIAKLRHFPARHGQALEAGLAGVDLRQMIHGMYRILYTFDDATVTVHAVRHGARRPLRPDELADRM